MEHDKEDPQLGQLEADETTTSKRDSPASEKVAYGFAPWGIGALVLLAIAWFLYPETEEQISPDSRPALTEIPAAVKALPPAPDIPVATPEPVTDAPDAQQVEVEMPPPPPTLQLEDSDGPVREELAGLHSSPMVKQSLQQDDLIQRGVAFTDGAGQGLVISKALGLTRPAGKFSTVKLEGREFIDPASYERYDDYALTIAEIDTAAAVSAFHRFRPLLEQAYEQLGYQGEDFDNTLIRALDLVLATPEITGRPEVKPKGGLYIFADPDLEALPPMHKQLLRMGPDNLKLVKKQASALRSALLNQ